VTSHDRHDPIVVAALAAGDLAGTDRDQALAQVQSCPDCASLHADLLAIAQATATLPPPIAHTERDFRLSPEQAAHLRPAGVRRWLPSWSARAILSRPLGVGLATFGLIGLLVGNAPMLGSAASSPAAAGGASVPGAAAQDGAVRSAASGGAGAGGEAAPLGSPASAASGGPLLASAAASAETPTSVSASGPPQAAATAAAGGVTQPGASEGAGNGSGVFGGYASGTSPRPKAGSDTNAASNPTPATSPNILFGMAIVAGIAILIASRRPRRRLD